MSKIIKNYIYNTIYQLLVLVVPIITAPYLARVLGAEKLGIYGYIISASTIIVSVGSLGIYSYANREIAYRRDNKEKLSQAFWEIIIIRIILFFVTSLLYFVIAFITSFTNYFMLYYFWLIANFADVSWVFVGLEKMKIPVIKNILAKLITVIGIFLLVKSEEDLWLYISLISLSTFISNLIIYPQLKDYIFKPNFGQFSKKIFKKHLIGSLYLFLPQMATIIYLNLDKIMIKNITGVNQQVGFYQQAEKIINIPLALLTGLSTVMMPRIANEYKKGNDQNINNYLSKALSFTLMLAFPMSIGIGVISFGFIPWFLGKEFTPSIIALIILSPIIITNALSGISGKQFLTATNQMHVLFKSHFLAVIINISLNFFLIPRFGFKGAAISSLISSVLSVLVQFNYMLKQINFKKLWENSFRYLIFSIIMGVIICLFIPNLSSEPSLTLFQIMLGGGTYFLFLIISKDELLFKLFKQLYNNYLEKNRK